MARVVDDSAYPNIRENDLVLLDQIEDVTTEALNRLEDRIITVVASGGSESFGYLKRMGAEIQPGVRFLEKIGLTGSSVGVAFRAGEKNRGRAPVTRQNIPRTPFGTISGLLDQKAPFVSLMFGFLLAPNSQKP